MQLGWSDWVSGMEIPGEADPLIQLNCRLILDSWRVRSESIQPGDDQITNWACLLSENKGVE